MNLTYQVNKPVEFIFDILSNMQKFAAVHPVITAIDNLSPNNYRVHETMKVAFVPIAFTYHASVEHNLEDKKIFIKATVMKFTNIEMNYDLIAVNNSTTINETIVVKSPFPIRLIVERIFRKQHSQLFKNIEALNQNILS